MPGDSDSKESACNVGTQVQSLGQDDPLEKEMATHLSILAWEIPWAEELGGLQSMGLQRVGHEATKHAQMGGDIRTGLIKSTPENI